VIERLPDEFFIMEEVIVFIDAGFLSKLSKHFGKGRYLKFDIIKFAKKLASNQNLACKHVFYYTAPPFQSYKPTSEENKRKESYDRFIKSINKNKEITIREGRCQKIKNTYHQKGVDTLVTMDLMSIPLLHKNIKKAILIACDSDFVPIISHLKELNLRTILYTYYDKNRKSNFSTSNELIKTVYKYILLKEEDFKNIQVK